MSNEIADAVDDSITPEKQLKAIRNVLAAYEREPDAADAHDFLMWIKAIASGDVEQTVGALIEAVLER